MQQQCKHPLWLLPQSLHYSKQKVKKKKSIDEILGVAIELCFGSQWQEVSLTLRRGVGPPMVSLRVSAPFPLHLFPSVVFKKPPPVDGLPLPTFSERLLLVLTHIYCPEAGFLRCVRPWFWQGCGSRRAVREMLFDQFSGVTICFSRARGIRVWFQLGSEGCVLCRRVLRQFQCMAIRLCKAISIKSITEQANVASGKY